MYHAGDNRVMRVTEEVWEEERSLAIGGCIEVRGKAPNCVGG